MNKMTDRVSQSLIYKLPSVPRRLVLETTFLLLFITGLSVVTFIFSLETPSGLLLAMILIAVFVVRLQKIAWLDEISFSEKIFRVVLYVVVGQMTYFVYDPLDSVVPIKILEIAGVIEIVKEPECPIHEYHSAVTTVWGSEKLILPDYLVVGGFMYNWQKLVVLGILPENHPWYRGAMTMNGNIYLSNPKECMDVTTFIHEATHVYQYQNETTGSKWKKLKKRIPDIYYQTFDQSVIYDYEGIEGLQRAKSEGRQITDFHPEQQAEIVEDYYRYHQLMTQIERPKEYMIVHYDLLKYFVDQM
jgi:hypothetical protein